MASDMNLICNKPECTLAQTGICMFNRDPATCPDRGMSEAQTSIQPDVENLTQPLTSPVQKAQLSSSYTLTSGQAERLMRERYCRVVGVLGSPGAGKTACFVSLYLLLSHGRLTNFSFRDSKTVRALEEISRGARKWNEANAPDTLTLHTKILDDRSAGFLHFKLKDDQTSEIYDFLIPDLPGEWTTALIDSNRNDRLGFLKSSDVLWIFVSGAELAGETARVVQHKITLLFDRLAALLGNLRPTVTIVITHADRFDIDDQQISKSVLKANSLGFPIKVARVASFSDRDGIPAGHGISELLGDLLNFATPPSSTFWIQDSKTECTRQINNFGIEKNHG